MPPADDSERRPRAVWVLAAAIAFLVVAVGVVIAPSDDEPVASSGPTSTAPVSVPAVTEDVDPELPSAPSDPTEPTLATTTSTTEPRFDAPPSQVPTPSSSPPDTEASTTTSSSSTTAPTTSTPPTTTTTPPAQAQAGPPHSSVAGEHEALRAALAEAKARWTAQIDLSQGYVFRTERLCFCPLADNEITVGADGTVEEQRNHAGDMEAKPPTIDDLFTSLEAAIAADADAIWVSFDEQRGFPVDLFIDPDRQIADDEQGRSVEWLVAAT